MTHYAHDPEREVITASWETGEGRTSSDVVPVPQLPALRARQLSLALELLSRELWHSYVHPASAAPSLEVNTEGWRRERARESFTKVAAAIREPNLPDDNGQRLAMTSPEEEAHEVGRHACLSEIAAEPLVEEAERELDAVERAELGDFTGRASQALELSRADASPTQVLRAHELLAEDPLDPRLASEVDPTSAAVAAAEWLLGAAEVAAESADMDPVDVIVAADGITKQDIEPPTTVIDRLLGEEDATDVVTELIRQALELADGEVEDLAEFLEDVAWRAGIAEEEAEVYTAPGEDAGPARLSIAPPQRAAPGLRESLLAGIRAACLVYEAPEAELGGVDDDDVSDASERLFVEALRTRMKARAE